jgi:hypothetical protein
VAHAIQRKALLLKLPVGSDLFHGEGRAGQGWAGRAGLGLARLSWTRPGLGWAGLHRGWALGALSSWAGPPSAPRAPLAAAAHYEPRPRWRPACRRDPRPGGRPAGPALPGGAALGQARQQARGARGRGAGSWRSCCRSRRAPPPGGQAPRRAATPRLAPKRSARSPGPNPGPSPAAQPRAAGAHHRVLSDRGRLAGGGEVGALHGLAVGATICLSSGAALKPAWRRARCARAPECCRRLRGRDWSADESSQLYSAGLPPH